MASSDITLVDRMELLDAILLERDGDFDKRYMLRSGRYSERRTRRKPSEAPMDLFAARTLWRAQEREKEVGRANRGRRPPPRKPAGSEKARDGVNAASLGSREGKKGNYVRVPRKVDAGFVKPKRKR